MEGNAGMPKKLVGCIGREVFSGSYSASSLEEPLFVFLTDVAFFQYRFRRITNMHVKFDMCIY